MGRNKKSRNGKVRFYLDLLTGEIFHPEIYHNIDPLQNSLQFVSIGIFYSFASFKATLDLPTLTYTVTRGKEKINEFKLSIEQRKYYVSQITKKLIN